MKVKSDSEVAQSCQLFATPWTAAYQAPPPTGFSRQEYWSGVPLPSLILNTNSPEFSLFSPSLFSEGMPSCVLFKTFFTFST